MRISATQIRVTWPFSAKDERDSPISFYTVKYYSLKGDSRSRRDVEQDLAFIDVTRNVTIDGLDPTLTYKVAVAANTASGRGSFSEEITVGCKHRVHIYRKP